MKKLSEKHKNYLARKARKGVQRSQRKRQLARWHRQYEKRSEHYSEISALPIIDKRVHLECPRDLSFENSHEELYELIRTARIAATFTQSQIIFDFENVESIFPTALLYLAAEIFRLRNLYPRRITGTYPRSPVMSAILDELGFFKLLRVQPTHEFTEEDEEQVIFVQMQSATSNIGKMIGDVQDSIFSKLAIERENQSKLYGALDEAMTNVSEHAYPEGEMKYPQDTGPYRPLRKRWWLLGYGNRKSKQVCFLLYDQGLTIPVTVPLTVWERLKIPFADFVSQLGVDATTDSAHIQIAAKVGRSRLEHSYRGKGIARMRSFVSDVPDTELQILSRYGEYRFLNAGGNCSEELSDHKRPICGTLVTWNIRLGDETEHENYKRAN